jgi:hypothetical protein
MIFFVVRPVRTSREIYAKLEEMDVSIPQRNGYNEINSA